MRLRYWGFRWDMADSRQFSLDRSADYHRGLQASGWFTLNPKPLGIEGTITRHMRGT